MPWKERIDFTSDDWVQIEEMCIIQCTGEEIAAVMHVDYDTLAARIREEYACGVSDYIKSFGNIGRRSLRRAQWKNAVDDGNTTMQIWLGKQYLEQRESKEEVSNIQEIHIVGGLPVQNVQEIPERKNND